MYALCYVGSQVTLAAVLTLAMFTVVNRPEGQ
jgi:hypothetical protein